jgi:hypothetical protein
MNQLLEAVQSKKKFIEQELTEFYTNFDSTF